MEDSWRKEKQGGRNRRSVGAQNSLKSLQYNKRGGRSTLAVSSTE